MKKTILTVLIAGAFAAGSVMLTGCSGSNPPAEEHAEGDGHEHMEGETHDEGEEGEAHVFACPMHPEITGNEGDKCSECGMDLEMVEHEHAEEHMEGDDHEHGDEHAEDDGHGHEEGDGHEH